MAILANKVAIVTGAITSIGYATAKLFARKGAAVVVAARRQKELDELAGSITSEGGQALALAGDVGDEAIAKALVDSAVSHFGGLDIAFNIATILGPVVPVPQMSHVDWDQVITTNLTSAFLSAKYQLPAMADRKGGTLVFTSTFVGYTAGVPGMAAYAASKAGLTGLTQALAAEHGPQNIRVNAFFPSGNTTRIGHEFANTPRALESVLRLHALKRLSTPDEIAQIALYMASETSSSTSGSAMLVNGGAPINCA